MKAKKIKVLDLMPSNDGDWIKLKSKSDEYIMHKCMYSSVNANLEYLKEDVLEIMRIVELSVVIDKKYAHKKNRPKEFIKLDCLALSIPSSDIDTLLLAMQDLKVSSFPDKKRYFSLNIGKTKIILTEEQFETLQYTFQKLSNRANNRNNKFLKEINLKNN